MARQRTLAERPKTTTKAADKRPAENALSNAPKRARTSAAPAVSDDVKKPKITKKSLQQRPKLVAPTERLDVFVFGDGSFGELGLGSKNSTDVKAPRLNSNLDAESVGVVSLAAGGMHAVALTHDNKIVTWGINDHGSLGRDTTWDGGLRDMDDANGSDSDSEDIELNPLESTPTAIPSNNLPLGVNFVQVAAGDSATFALTDDGHIYGWGTFRDQNGEKGFYLTPNDGVIGILDKPMLIPTLKNITSLCAGSNFCLALDVHGNVSTWGVGDQNQLGRRLVARRRNAALIPTHVALPKNKIVSIHAGDNHAFAIDTDGDTWAWGLNNFAQCGIVQGAGEDGGTVIKPQKVKSLVGKNMKMVEGGAHHSIAVTHSGECLVWGRMDGGQMGLDGSTLRLDNPDKVALDERGNPRILLQPTRVPVDNCVHVAAGPDHNIVITSEGKAYSWGFNVNYQCGQGTGDDILVATLMNGKQIRERKLNWAGAGGQYSMLASVHPLVNGVVN